MARWALAVEQGQEPREGAISGLEVGTRKGALCPAEPPCPPTHSSLCCQMFFSGGPRWDPQCCALRAVFGRTPSRSLSPVPPCCRHCPAWKGEAGVSFHTHTVVTPICSVCLIQPLCPPSVSHPAQPQPGHFTSLLCVLLQ